MENIKKKKKSIGAMYTRENFEIKKKMKKKIKNWLVVAILANIFKMWFIFFNFVIYYNFYLKYVQVQMILINKTEKRKMQFKCIL